MASERAVFAIRGLVVFAGLLGLSLALSAYDDWKDFDADLNRQLTRMDTRLDQAQLLFERTLAEAGRDTSALAGLPSMAAAIEDAAAAAGARQALRQVIALHADYMQTRLLDAQGQERIRFDRYRDRVFETRGEGLQNKAHRYYVEAAGRLGPHQMYVSPIDLNVEHGEIERPLRPVIRLAAPVIAPDGRNLGTTIINHDVAPLFADLRALFQADTGALFAAKPDGTWMIGPDPTLNWGVQLGHGARFGDRFTDAWTQAQGRSRGSVRTADGWFAYRQTTIDIAPDITLTGQPAPGWLFVHVPAPALKWHPLQDAHSDLRPLLLQITLVAIVAFGVTLLWTRLTRAQRRHAVSLRNLRLAGVIYDNADEALFVTDADQRIESVNDAATRITGFSKGELIGSTPRLWRSGRHDRQFYTTLWRTIERDGQWSGEIINRRRNGELFSAWESITAVRDGEGAIVNFVAVMTDISTLKLAEDQLRHLAFHDPLSGLPNRMLFKNNLEQLIELCRRADSSFAIAVIDLDHFKVVNDSLGHQAGDELIKVVAQRLRDGSRREDTVARLGGDEFAIIMPGVESAEVTAAVIRRTLAEVAQPVLLEGRAVQPECSTGLALFPDDGTSPTDLFKAADAAMYESKRRRKHECIFHSAELQARAETRMELELSLRQALDNNELELLYQPQVDLETGRIVGAEALLRWHHPSRGLILPSAFIPIAEESALINRIGTWVATQACAQARRWVHATPAPLRVGINISSHQLGNRHGRDALLESLATTGEAGTACPIELELSEAMFYDGADSIAFLHRLRRRGITIAIDDFGVGRSSLLQLRDLPIDRIKLSGEFVRTMDTDVSSLAIVHAVLELGRRMGTAVLAENVETTDQRDALMAFGCREAQGYLFGGPMTAAEFTDCLAGADRPGNAQPTLAED